MSQLNPETVEDFIEYGMKACEEAEVFLGHGTDSMWDEVLVLVLHVLNLPITSDRNILQNTLTHEQKEAVLALIKRRINERIPACYLINESWFCGLSFYVDERVIIPRSPIAECIEHAHPSDTQMEVLWQCLGRLFAGGCLQPAGLIHSLQTRRLQRLVERFEHVLSPAGTREVTCLRRERSGCCAEGAPRGQQLCLDSS